MADFGSFLNTYWVQTIGIPLLIFAARVADVSLGTLRMVFVSRGNKKWSAVLGFFEVLIWISVISYIFQHLTGVANYLAYALGFAAGNYVGLRIEEKMAMGLLGVTIITNRDARELIATLRENQFGLTSVSATGATGRVRMVMTVIRRKNLEPLRKIVENLHPSAFMTVQMVKSVSKDLYPYAELAKRSFDPFQWFRKGK